MATSVFDSEGMQMIIEMVVGSIGAIIGLWFLKRRSAGHGSSNVNSSDKASPSGEADKPPG